MRKLPVQRTPYGEEKIIFTSIVFIAAVLRLWNYWGWSFTHDELSAIVRLDFNSLAELWKNGIRPDGHPAFVQIFLWISTKIFGMTEAAIRFPFVIAGIGSVALLYFIAKRWFGLTTAYFSSLSLAILDFPILYSQIARPYAFGLFFCLLAVWCWTELLLGSNEKMYRKAILYGIATVLCMLTHYFAFFFALIVAITGFFFLKKETVKPYLISGIIAILIFLPHISLSLHQFGLAGVGDWLARPHIDFLWKFILYACNDSPLVVISFAIISLSALLMYHLEFSFSKLHIVCIAWFLLPFLAGYYYSVRVNPVLQYSTLLFSFPFLLLLVFSFIKESNKKFNNTLLASLSVILLFSTVVEGKFYSREYFGVFKEINHAATDLQKKYGADKMTTVLNTSTRDIFDFYFKQNNESVRFDFQAGDDSSFVPDMLKKIGQANTPYFMYGWSNFRSAYEIPEMIKRKYPYIIYDEKHFNSEITLFSKTGSCKRDTIFYSHLGFESPVPVHVRIDSVKTDSSFSHSGKHSLKVEPKDKFCFTFKTTVKQLLPDNNGCVNLSAWIYTKEKFNSQIVMDIGQGTTQNDWTAKLTPKFIKQTGAWQEVFVTFQLPSSAYPDDEIKLFIWNNNKNSFWLDDLTIASFADSKYDYYAPSFRK